MTDLDRIAALERDRDTLRAEVERLRELGAALMDPVETAGSRCLAEDGPVCDDLLLVTQDRDLRRKFDKAYRKLKAALASARGQEGT